MAVALVAAIEQLQSALVVAGNGNGSSSSNRNAIAFVVAGSGSDTRAGKLNLCPSTKGVDQFMPRRGWLLTPYRPPSTATLHALHKIRCDSVRVQ